MNSQNNLNKAIPLVKENNQLTQRALWGLLAGIFLISFSLLAFEITLTRILSVVLAYHYVFIVISLALLGLGMGGILVYFLRRQATTEDRGFGSLIIYPSLFSLSIPLSVILITQIAYAESTINNILLYCLLLFIPFFFVGAFLAEVFHTFPNLSAKLYGADLIGAAIGSLGVVLILNNLDSTNSSFLLAFIAAAATLLMATIIPEKKSLKIALPIVSLVITISLLGINLFSAYLPNLPMGTNPTKEIYTVLHATSYQGKIIETRWSAFGRTDLVTPTANSDLMALFIDGTSGAVMYRFNGDILNPDPAIANLKTEFPGYFPFLFLSEKERENALIIGPGGGRDILLALMGGVKKITAVEVNKELVDIVREYADYNGGIFTDRDNITVTVDEGRNFLKRQREKYDIIMLSLPVTRTSRSLEGYVLTENFLFTTDAINDYLEHLTDEGSLIVVGHSPVDTMRLLSISLATLKERGVASTEAMNQIYLVGWEKFPTFVLKKTPFTPVVRESIRQKISQYKYGSPEIDAINEGKVNFDEVVRALKKQGIDVSPVSDDSPFYYKFEVGMPRPVSLVFWLSIIMLLLTILVPSLYLTLWKKKLSRRQLRLRDKTGFNRNTFRFIILFMMLGMGFMLVEISLIQRLILFLGQPVLSLAVLLFSLLVGVGIGSAFSGRLSPAKLAKVTAFIGLAIVALLLIYTFLLPPIFSQLLGLPLAIRLLATVVLLTPLGFLMGFPFPSGLRLLKETKMENYIPWMWGINGVSSVLGSALTMVIAISWGLTEALLVAACGYFIVFLIFQTTQYQGSPVEK